MVPHIRILPFFAITTLSEKGKIKKKREKKKGRRKKERLEKRVAVLSYTTCPVEISVTYPRTVRS